MNKKEQTSTNPEARPTSNGWRTFGIIVITVMVTVGIGYWAVSTYLFPTSFEPVVLGQKKQKELNQKVMRLGAAAREDSEQQTLEPEPYKESGADREIYFTERELNALLNRNTDLADRLAIDLSEALASAKLLINVPPDFPILGGRTVKVTAGLGLRMIQDRLSVKFKGLSLWGVPLPNAWLGNMKDVDLVRKFGQQGGFWQAVNQGVEEIEVKEGKLRIRLAK